MKTKKTKVVVVNHASSGMKDVLIKSGTKLYQVLTDNASLASKSKSVIPLLSQGMKQLIDAGTQVAKTKVQPLVKEWRESRRPH